jgi:CubicO group peptidase (beta-lactamase class C family)
VTLLTWALLMVAVEPRVQTVIGAIGEPGCPRLFPMLSASFAREFPAEKWPAWCGFVGALGEVEALGPKDGWLRFRGTSRGRRIRLDVGFDGEGKVAGLMAVLDDSVPEAEARLPLDQELERVREAHRLPGLSALVLRDGEVVSVAAAGVRRLGGGQRVTIDDRWHLGSDTKAMTATLAGMLVDEKRLAWTSTVGEVLARWKDIHPALAKVTLEMLLAHRGGLPAAVSPAEWSRMWAARDQIAERSRAVRALLRLPPGNVGEFLYSNFGYLVAGVMIEQVTGQPWEVVMRKRLFEPLKMSSCGFGAPGSPGKVDQPWGHRRDGSTLTPMPPGPEADNPPSLGPAGTVHCGLRDWARFAQMHLDGARGKATLVSAATMAKLHAPWPGGDYALGWVTGKAGGTGVLVHDGSNTLFFARAQLVPERNAAFLVTANAPGPAAVQAVDQVVFYLRARYLK